MLIGLGGSLHCVGMCSPLTATLTKGKVENLLYQLGRLLAYLLLGLSAGWLTSLINIKQDSPLINSLPLLTLGFAILFIGIKGLVSKGKNLTNTSSTIHTLYSQALVKLNKLGKFSIIPIGFMTLLLPCGLLYGVVLIAGVTGNPLLGATSLFFFWLGTLPAVSFGSEIINLIFKPIKNKIPKSSSAFLIVIGLFTITYRLYSLYGTDAPLCH